MPATTYRMVGRPHPNEVATAAPVPVSPQPPTIEETATTQEELTPVPVAAQVEAASTVVETEVVDPTPASASCPTWDATWTKAKLLEAAAILNLPVTVDSTKAQIIAALTAATSS